MPDYPSAVLRSTDPESIVLEIDGRRVAVTLAPSARARRMTLRQDVRRGGFRLTMPAGVSADAAEAMVRRHAGWLAAQLRKTPAAIGLVPGASVPVAGRERMIRHDPDGRHVVVMTDDALTTGGDSRHVPRRIEDFLRALARRDLAALVRGHALALGRPVAAVTVRDTVSRWGSCSSTGRISLSWRLILAPEWIASYVAAHEVAHLVEMNHGPGFWRVCRTLFPETDAARAWLRRHGASLHRYGGADRNG